MLYGDLARWVLGTMRMSEVYQPAAIVCLIYHGGTATLDQIHAQLENRRSVDAAGKSHQRADGRHVNHITGKKLRVLALVAMYDQV